MAEVGDRPGEFISTAVSLRIRASDVDDVLVFFKIGIYVCEKIFRDTEFRKNRVFVYFVAFDFVENLHSVGNHLRMCREEGCHFLFAIQVFLLGVVETVFVINVGVGGEADEPVVCRSVLLFHEMHVVGGNDLHPCFFRK